MNDIDKLHSWRNLTIAAIAIVGILLVGGMASADAPKPEPLEPGKTWIQWPPWDEQAERALNNLEENPNAGRFDRVGDAIRYFNRGLGIFDVAGPYQHINQNDVGLVALHYGFKVNQPGYWYLFDFSWLTCYLETGNRDCAEQRIDIADLSMVTARHGCFWLDSCYWPWPDAPFKRQQAADRLFELQQEYDLQQLLGGAQ